MAKVRFLLSCFLLLCLANCKRVSEDRLGKELAFNPEVGSVLTDVSTEPLEIITAEESILEVPEVLQPPVKMTLPEIYTSQIGVREATGKNDGPEVEMYLQTVGLKKGYAWCSAFVKWSLEEAEIPNKINAWSPTAENRNNLVYQSRKFIQEPKPGDVFTIYYPRLKRIGHTGFYHQRHNDMSYETVEGNTNAAGSREGDGVYKKYRSFNATHSISRWE